MSDRVFAAYQELLASDYMCALPVPEIMEVALNNGHAPSFTVETCMKAQSVYHVDKEILVAIFNNSISLTDLKLFSKSGPEFCVGLNIYYFKKFHFSNRFEITERSQSRDGEKIVIRCRAQAKERNQEIISMECVFVNGKLQKVDDRTSKVQALYNIPAEDYFLQGDNLMDYFREHGKLEILPSGRITWELRLLDCQIDTFKVIQENGVLPPYLSNMEIWGLMLGDLNYVEKLQKKISEELAVINDYSLDRDTLVLHGERLLGRWSEKIAYNSLTRYSGPGMVNVVGLDEMLEKFEAAFRSYYQEFRENLKSIGFNEEESEILKSTDATAQKIEKSFADMKEQNSARAGQLKRQARKERVGAIASGIGSFLGKTAIWIIILLAGYFLIQYMTDQPISFDFVDAGIVLPANEEVQIGEQVWMSKNLDVSTFRNGDPIPQASTSEEWNEAGENGKPVWCYYDFDPANGASYGKLYNFYAVKDRRKIAPKGWHVATDEEWTTLTETLTGDEVDQLKSDGGWKCGMTDHGGSNSSGFYAVPAGAVLGVGTSMYAGFEASWWTSKADGDYNAWSRTIRCTGQEVASESYRAKTNGLSVRCVKDH